MKHNMLLMTLLATGFLTCAPVLAKNGKQNNPHLPDPVTDADFREHSTEKVELGRNLMFDKILSGNLNISCATCHHSLTDTGDGLSLPVGEGGRGLGVTRDTGSDKDAIHERVPRNAPPVFNLGAHEFTVLFHDGRVEVDPSFPSGCKTPAGYELPDTLENILACQAMFPVTSPAEMAGQVDENGIAENAIAAAADRGELEIVWQLLAERLQQNEHYVDLFIAAFDDINVANDITYAHAANAIAAFEGTRWRADNSPFDRYLRGDRKAMSKNALEGMRLFYKGKHKGKRNGHRCAHCHSGKFQTDHSFHAIAMPQIGPGKGDGTTVMGHDDYGREQVTLDPADRYTFRTPTLRNVALTAPYGHSGCYNSLRAVVEHHIDAVNSLRSYDGEQAVLPSRRDLDDIDFIVMNDADSVEAIAAAAYDFPAMDYSDEDVDRIMDFLHALTDPASIDLRNDTPASVPSGLTLAE
ncbi:MAG: cytochrome c peroxidase [Thiogranum sp.]